MKLKIVWAIGLVLGVVLGLNLVPFKISGKAAVENNSLVNSECESVLMSHGYKTKKVVILLHGFTNCPKQFVPLAQEMYQRGDNVYIPRLPYHGYTDRMTTEIAKLNTNELATTITDSLKLTKALGQETVVVGLSGGAVMAAWAGQNLDNINKVILIAPNFAYWDSPLWIRKLNIWALTKAPNFWVWWDDKTQEKIPGPQYAYPRFSSNAIGEIFKMGYVTTIEAQQTSSKTSNLVLVLTQDDKAVSRQAAIDLLESWKKQGANTNLFEFPSSLHLPHDMIDINQPGQQTKIVYAKLLELVEN